MLQDLIKMRTLPAWSSGKNVPLLHLNQSLCPAPVAPAKCSRGRPVKPVTHPSDSPVQACRHAVQIAHCLHEWTVFPAESLKRSRGEVSLGV